MITIPTISQLYQSILADIQAEYGTSIPPFGKNFLRAIAIVQAAKLKIFYLAIGNLQKNLFVDTADPEASGGTLERFGRIKLKRNPFPAQAGQYQVEVTGTIGSIIPASSTFKSNDDTLSPGKLYVLDVAYQLVAATDAITVRALEPGVGSRLLIGDKLSATAPIAGVNKIVTVTLEPVEPLAPESIEDYRRKAEAAYQLEPNGGAPSDYRLWALDVQGVKQVYPFAKTGFANEIDLFVEATPIDSTDGVGTPSAQMLIDVEAVVEMDPDITKPLNERGRRPVGVHQIHYLPVTIKQVDIEIVGFVGITATIQTEIFNALKAMIDTVRPFVAGADTLESKNDILDHNRIIAVILTVRPGSTFGSIILNIDSVAVPSITMIGGDIPHLSTVTYS